jgi:hypothetical protein
VRVTSATVGTNASPGATANANLHFASKGSFEALNRGFSANLGVFLISSSAYRKTGRSKLILGTRPERKQSVRWNIGSSHGLALSQAANSELCGSTVSLFSRALPQQRTNRPTTRARAEPGDSKRICEGSQVRRTSPKSETAAEEVIRARTTERKRPRAPLSS